MLRDLAQLLTMYEVIYENLVATGLSQEQAFDQTARLIIQAEVQMVIGRLRASPGGQRMLDHLRTYWDQQGLPVPWDNVLELPSRVRT